VSTKLKAAFVINLVVAFVGLIVGSLYLISEGITDYHKAVIGVDWSTLAPGVQTLLIILMKGTGVASFITGLSIAIFNIFPLRHGENWARWAIVCVGLSGLLPMLAGAGYLAVTTGAPSPWWLSAALVVLLLVAFFLSGKLKEAP